MTAPARLIRMRPQDIVAETGLGKDMVYAMLKDGTIPNLRYGRQFIISRQAFERWWAECGRSENRRAA